MYWKMIEVVLPKTCGGEEIGAYFWRDSDNNSKWENGKPPIGAGIYCDASFKPLREEDLNSIMRIPQLRIEFSKKRSRTYWKKFG